MKSKFNIWLNIVTMCICICAITIGIYSLKQANLTVSGSIGFVSSKIKYDVTAQMKGYMTKSEDDKPLFHDEFESLDVNTNANDEKSIALSEIYFSNPEGSETVSDIVIELTITNNSSYPIEATLGLPNNETILTNVDFTKSQNVVAQMGTTTDKGKTQTMTINMSLVGTELTSTPVAFNFSITLEKFEQIKYDEDIGYYTTMGSHIVGSGTSQKVKAVKWLPIAKYNSSYTTTGLYNYEPFSNTTEPTTGNKYYFISEKVLDSNDNLDTLPSGADGYTYGVTYNLMTWDNDNSNFLDAEYTALSANNYLASDVRALLNGESVYNYQYGINSTFDYCGNQINLVKEYGLQGFTYDSIIERSTQELYEGDGLSNDYSTVVSAMGSDLKTNDKLWLLSYREAIKYIKYISICPCTFLSNISTASWWMRSPLDNLYYCDCAFGGVIEHSPGFAQNVINNEGIRPAFALAL